MSVYAMTTKPIVICHYYTVQQTTASSQTNISILLPSKILVQIGIKYKIYIEHWGLFSVPHLLWVCDTCHPFIKIISEDSLHSRLYCRALSSGAVTIHSLETLFAWNSHDQRMKKRRKRSIRISHEENTRYSCEFYSISCDLYMIIIRN